MYCLTASLDMHNLLIYYGKDTCLIERPDLSHTCKVVLTLRYYLKNKQYDLYTDRLIKTLKPQTLLFHQ